MPGWWGAGAGHCQCLLSPPGSPRSGVLLQAEHSAPRAALRVGCQLLLCIQSSLRVGSALPYRTHSLGLGPLTALLKLQVPVSPGGSRMAQRRASNWRNVFLYLLCYWFGAEKLSLKFKLHIKENWRCQTNRSTSPTQLPHHWRPPHPPAVWRDTHTRGHSQGWDTSAPPSAVSFVYQESAVSVSKCLPHNPKNRDHF